MSQETRRRLAARERLEPQPQDESEVPEALKLPHFAKGIERNALDPERLHVGRFSEGAEQLPEDIPSKEHIGRFSEGAERLPEDIPSKEHIGRYSEGLEHEPSATVRPGSAPRRSA